MEKIVSLVENFGTYQGREYDSFTLTTYTMDHDNASQRLIIGGRIVQYKIAKQVYDRLGGDNFFKGLINKEVLISCNTNNYNGRISRILTDLKLV